MDRLLRTEKHVATIFGHPILEPTMLDYDLAFTTGRILAEEDFAVAIAYQSIKSAIASGARSASGYLVAVKVGDSSTVEDEEELCDECILVRRRIEQMNMLFELANTIVVLPGGINTLANVSYAWKADIVLKTSKTFYLLGDRWQKFIQIAQDNGILSLDILHNTRIVRNAEQLKLELRM